MNRQVDKEDMVYMYSGILDSHKKNEILPFAAIWMDLENIMLNEVSQRKTNTVSYHLYMKSKKPNSQKPREEWWLPGAGNWGKWGDIGQRLQISSYKMNKF